MTRGDAISCLVRSAPSGPTSSLGLAWFYKDNWASAPHGADFKEE
jgi:hypothetical protein